MTTATAAPEAVADTWSEPARRLPLRWGSYVSRYAAGLAAFVLYAVALAAVENWQDLIGHSTAQDTAVIAGLVVPVVVGAVLLPGRAPRRAVAVVLLLVAGHGTFLACVASGLGELTRVGDSLLRLLVLGAAAIAALGWSVARGRSAWATTAAAAAAGVVAILGLLAIQDWVLSCAYGCVTAGQMWLRGAVVFTLVPAVGAITGAWVGRALDQRLPAWLIRRGERRASEVAGAQERYLREQAERAGAWQRAWEESNPGQPLPPLPVPGAPADRLNVPALLALIFGLLASGLVAVVLGHVAVAQIRRTGERGRGMAVAGLVLGYAETAGWAVVVAVALLAR